MDKDGLEMRPTGGEVQQEQCGGDEGLTCGGCWQTRSANVFPVVGGEKESMPCMCHHASLRTRTARMHVPASWPLLHSRMLLVEWRISPMWGPRRWRPLVSSGMAE